MTPFTLRLLRLKRRLYSRDLLNLAAVITAVFLAAQGKDPHVAIPLLLTYLGFTFWRWVLVFLSRESKNLLLALVVAGLFESINRAMFNNSSHTRFTLFQELPGTSRIIPTCRYRRGGGDPLKEAERSRCSYDNHEGITGQVWASAEDDTDIQILPDFQNRRSLMEAYYIDELKVSRQTVRAISDFMINVSAILSYRALDARQHALGLISIDIRDATVTWDSEDATITVEPHSSSPSERPFIVDLNDLSFFGQIVSNVLESFNIAGRRISYE